MIGTFNFTISKNTNKTRVGRGGKGGKTCGRGHNGQKSRSGFSRRRMFVGGQTRLSLSIPKCGFTSYKSVRNKRTHVTLGTHSVKSMDTISITTLRDAGLIRALTTHVKLFNNGGVLHPNVVVQDSIVLTSSVREMIKQQ